MAELPLVELLDRRTQEDFRQALIESNFPREASMQPEAIAALALVAQHPPKLRHIALAILSSPARDELDAYALIEGVDGRGMSWTLTTRGEDIAGVLEAAAPEPVDDQRKRDLEHLRALGLQASEALRGRP